MNTIVPLEDQRQGRSLFTDTGGMTSAPADKQKSKKSTSEEGVKFSTAPEPKQKDGKEMITMSTFGHEEANGSNDTESSKESEKEGKTTKSASETQTKVMVEQELVSKF